MKIVILDAKTLGDDIEFSVFNKLGDVSVYQTTSSLQLKDRIKDADIIIVNKKIEIDMRYGNRLR